MIAKSGAAISCSVPVRPLLFRQVFRACALFADSCIPPPPFTGIYRAYFGGGRCQRPTSTKGIGEGGAVGPPAAILSAVNDALLAIGAEVHDLPLTPVRILDAISAGRALRSRQS